MNEFLNFGTVLFLIFVGIIYIIHFIKAVEITFNLYKNDTKYITETSQKVLSGVYCFITLLFRLIPIFGMFYVFDSDNLNSKRKDDGSLLDLALKILTILVILSALLGCILMTIND